MTNQTSSLKIRLSPMTRSKVHKVKKVEKPKKIQLGRVGLRQFALARATSASLPKPDFDALRFTQVLRQESKKKYSCPVCLDTVVAPVRTMCGHIYCRYCFEDLVQIGQLCAICRTELNQQDFRGCKITREWALMHHGVESPQELAQKQERFREYLRIESMRKVRRTTPLGSSVEYRIGNTSKWILGKITEKKAQTFVITTYASKHNTIIKFECKYKSRLACLQGCFTTHKPRVVRTAEVQKNAIVVNIQRDLQ